MKTGIVNSFRSIIVFCFIIILSSIILPNWTLAESWSGKYATMFWSNVCYDKLNNGLLAVSENSIYVSKNEGATWSKTNWNNGSVKKMISTSSQVLILSNSNEVFSTSDLGTSWKNIYGGQFGGVWNLSANDSGKILASSESGLIFSTNGGTSWVKTSGTMYGGEDIHVDGDGRFFAAQYDFVIYRSLDNGANWSKTTNTFQSSPCALESSSDGTLYVGTYWNGILKSTDHGVSWVDSSNGLPGGRGVFKVLAASNSKIYALVGDQIGSLGLFFSNNSGNSWQPAQGGLTTIQNVVSHWVTANEATVWLSQWSYGVGKSVNNGITWVGFQGFIPENVIAMAPTSTGTLFVGSPSLGVWKTSDRGNSWFDMNHELTSYDMQVQDMLRADNDTIVVAPYSPGNILLKSYSSTSWQRLNYGSYTFGPMSKATDGTLLSGNWWDGVWTSDNNGNSWNKLPGWPNDTGSRVTGKTTDGTYYAERKSSSWGLYKYAKTGNWDYVAFANTPIITFLVTHDDNLLVGTDNGLFISKNAGGNWQDFSSGLSPYHSRFSALIESCDGTLYLATEQGEVYKHIQGEPAWKTMDFPTNDYVTNVYSLALMKGYLYSGTNNGVLYTNVNSCQDYPLEPIIPPPILPALYILLNDGNQNL